MRKSLFIHAALACTLVSFAAFLCACGGDSSSDSDSSPSSSSASTPATSGTNEVHSTVHIAPFAGEPTVQDATLVVENNSASPHDIIFDGRNIGTAQARQTVIADIFHGTHTITCGPVTQTLLIPSGQTGTITVN